MLTIGYLLVGLGVIVGGYKGYKLFRKSTWIGTTKGLMSTGFKYVVFGAFAGAIVGALILQGVSKIFVGKTISKIDTYNRVIYYENEDVDDENYGEYEPNSQNIDNSVIWDKSEDDPMLQDVNDAQSYMIPGSDSRYLDRAELTGLSEYDLRIARNEIYARHGRIFKDQTLSSYFNAKEWYYPTIQPDDFDEDSLSAIEKANVNLIKEVEATK